MTRDELQDLIARHADGALDAADALLAESAIAAAPELREQVERWRVVRRAAQRDYLAIRPPEQLRAAIRSRLRAVEGRKRVLRFAGALSGVAAVIALWLALRTPQAIPARTVAPEVVAESYLACAKSARHVGYTLTRPNCTLTAKHTLATHVNYKFVIPDLTASGFDLDGVCHCLPSLPELDAVHAHYRSLAGGKEKPESFVSVFSFRERIRLGGAQVDHSVVRDYERAVAGNVSVVKWDEGAGSFALCGEASPEHLETIADEVRVARALARDSALIFAFVLRP